ncbi:hypothetical protein GCM10027446_18640 [Angustibacter peucedani]
MSWEGLLAPGLELADSPAETARFGVSIARVHVAPDDDGPDVEDRLRDLLAAAHADVVVLRYPADRVALGAVAATSGRDVLAAGALTYWGAPSGAVLDPRADGPDRGLAVVTAAEHGSGVEDVVDAVVAASFAGYGNHYTSDPLLDDDLALAGYQEWARRSVTAHPDDVLLLLHDGEPVGVATCDEQPELGDLEVLLAGLVPDAQGQGWYGTLLAACARHAAERGLARTTISTQVHNVRVQRAWAKAGLRPFAAVETLHCVRRGLL